MSPRPYVLAETTLGEIGAVRFEVAVLPWGATEPHNQHLPFGTDCLEAQSVGIEAARTAWERGARVVVLPTVPFGANVQQLGIPLTINMSPSTQARVLADVVESLAACGVPKLVVLNGHGGNDFRGMIRELQGRTELFLCAVDWYRAAAAEGFFDDPGDHAGQLETSVMMHLAPELVLPLDRAGPGKARVFRVQALREGWAWAPRDWAKVTTDTGVGDPKGSSAERGAAFFEAVVTRVADFLVELARLDSTDPYEAG